MTQTLRLAIDKPNSQDLFKGIKILVTIFLKQWQYIVLQNPGEPAKFIDRLPVF